MVLFYLLLAASLFFLQNFLPLPSPWRLDLMTLGLVFISLQASFTVSVIMALIFGFALDCYGMAPLGLQTGMLLVAVLGVKMLRWQLNFFYIMPQIVGVAVIATLQTVCMAVLLHLVLPVRVIYPAIIYQSFIQISVTALSAPLFLASFGLLEKFWRRWFFI